MCLNGKHDTDDITSQLNDIILHQRLNIVFERKYDEFLTLGILSKLKINISFY